MIPYRKTYETKPHQEILGWRQGEKSTKSLRSPLNISKPYRVKSLADFHKSPKYPEYEPESPWLPLLAPRAQYSLLNPLQHSFNSPNSNSIDPGCIYETEKLSVLHRPNVYSLSTRSNDSGGNFHSYKGSFDFKDNIDLGKLTRLDIPESSSIEEKEGFSNRVKILDDIEGKIQEKKENERKFLPTINKKTDQIKDLPESTSKKHKLNHKILKKNNSKTDTNKDEDHEARFEEPSAGRQFQGKKLAHIEKADTTTISSSNTEVSEDHPQAKFHPAPVLPINSNFTPKDKPLSTTHRSAEVTTNLSKPKPKQVPTPSNKNPAKDPEEFPVLDFHQNFSPISPNLAHNNEFITSYNPPSKIESILQQRTLEYSQIINLAPIKEVSDKIETENQNSARSSEPCKSPLPVQSYEKVLERKTNINRQFKSRSQRNTTKQKSKATWDDGVEMDKEDLKKESFDMNTFRKSIDAIGKKSVIDLENFGKFELDKIEKSEKNEKNEKNEKTGTHDKNDKRSFRESKAQLVKELTRKLTENESLNPKKPQIKVNIIPSNKDKKKNQKLRRTSSLIQSGDKLQVPKRREKRRSTSGEASPKPTIIDESYQSQNPVDRFIHNYSMSLISLLSILYVNLKENIESMTQEINPTGAKRESIKRSSLFKQHTKRKSKLIKRRMKIELSVVMKPNKTKGKLDSSKIIENLKTSIFSEGVKKELISAIKNTEHKTKTHTLTKKMNAIINNRIKIRQESDVEDSKSNLNDSSKSESLDQSEENNPDEPDSDDLNSITSLHPDYKKKNMMKFLADYNLNNEKAMSSRNSLASRQSIKPLKMIENELDEVDFNVNPYIFNENLDDIDEELARMTWCNPKYIKKFLFSSQVQQDIIKDFRNNFIEDHIMNEYEEGLDILNLEYRMLKKRFYDMQGLSSIDGEETDYKLIMTDPYQMSDLDTRQFEIEKVRKYLRQLKYLKNKPKNFVNKPETRTFSGLTKVEGVIMLKSKLPDPKTPKPLLNL